MDYLEIAAVRHLLHQRLAEAHVDRALDLADDCCGIDRSAHVVRDPDGGHTDDACFGIDVHLSDAGAVRIRRGRADAGAAVFPGAHRRRVGADRADGSLRGLRQLDRLGERHPALAILGIEYAAVREGQPLDRHLELFRRMEREDLAGALRGLQRRVPGHERDAARVAAEVDRGEVGVARDDDDVERIDAEDFGDDVGEDRIRSLSDFRRAAEHRDAAAPVAFQLHARMRHVVPVDRQAGARDVARAGEPDATPFGQLTEFLLPLRSLDDFVDALAETHRAHA